MARGLSPFDPPSVAFKAGRLLLSEARELLATGNSFALESTISGKAQVGLLQEAIATGYKVVIHFLWLPSVKESIARVRQRVRKGGHDVPVPDIRRRYPRLLENLVTLYLPIADEWYFWDSHALPPVLLANFDTHAIADVEEFLHLR